MSTDTLAALRHTPNGTKLDSHPGTMLNQSIDIYRFDIILSNDYPNNIWLDSIQVWLIDGKGDILFLVASPSAK